MVNRRQFLKTTTAAAMTGLIYSCSSTVESEKQECSIRTISYNIRKCYGSQDVDADPGLVNIAKAQMPLRIAFELALYEPDIVTFQESPPEPVVAQIAGRLDMHYAFFPGGEGNPGAVLSRCPVIESQNCPLKNYSQRPKPLFTRHWGRAVLDSPLGNLIIYSAHLWPYEKGNDGKEVQEILAVMQPDLEADHPLIFQGDLNHTPAGPEYARWKSAGLIDAFATAGEGIPFTCCNPDTRKSPVPNERIDYIWLHGPIAQKLRRCRVLFERAFKNCPEDPRSFGLSDHLPLTAMFA